MLLVAGRTRDEVAGPLDVDLDNRIAEDFNEDDDRTAWALLAVLGDVIAMERSNCGDPSLGALQSLSAGGRAAP